MVPPDSVVVIDRFISASSARDAISSLEKLVDAFKDNGSKQNEDGDKVIWDPNWIFEHDETAEHLVWLLQHGTLKVNEIPCEEGVNLVCQLYQHLIKTPDALKKPSPGLLLESLLDVLDSSEQPVYVRVLALRLLEEISKRHKQIAINQWLQAPNGLHRIADLLAIDVDNNPMEEAVRNQALIVAKLLAHEPPMAKVFLFAEVECKLLDLCWKEGGLTKGNPIVFDALELIEELMKQADKSLQDLVWQRPNVAPRFSQLLDLRGGEEFLHPPQNSSKDSERDSEDDDLDSLLASGDTKAPMKADKASAEKLQIPYLLAAEENVIKIVLDILCLLMETDSVRPTVWQQHSGLCNFVWDLALIRGPLDPPVFALPSPTLQQKALRVVSDKFNDPIAMDNRSGLDTLLYLVCTGGETAENFNDKLGISQSALSVLRQCLSGDRIHDILIRTLAPPPTEDENAPPPGPTVVQKLWNTVQENLSSDISDRRTIFLSGALGGLGLMLCDEQSREIMSKVAPIGLDQLLESLHEEKDDFVQCSLVRFFCEWIYECPFIAHNMLCSTASTHLAGMAASESSYQSLIHLLLGLAMEYMTKEEECGGWSRNGILQIIIKLGTSKYTSSLEGLKQTTNSKMPWVVSEMEQKNWAKFCNQAILSVRKRVVEELAGGSGDDEDENDKDDEITTGKDDNNSFSNRGVKPLQRLISQQSKEMDAMRIEMELMRSKIASQDDQLITWKRRIESTPTELDDLLNEFTSKNITLEETIRDLKLQVERQKSESENEAKVFEERLSESEVEAERLRAVEQEVRDDLERTEQEMRSLSEAYANLEEDYQKNQSHQDVGAPAGETSQQLQGEDSHQQSETASTTIDTLRAENDLLKNDARAADEWMSMAVQKLNDIGAKNVELEKQVAGLNNEIRTAEERAFSVENLELELEREQKKSETLDVRVTEAQEALANYENIENQIQTEQKRYADLEKRFFEVEEESKLTAACLEDERKAKSERITEAQKALSKYENIENQIQNEQKRYANLERQLLEAQEEIKTTVARLEEERKSKAEIEKQLSNSSPEYSNGESAPTQTVSRNIEELEVLRSEYDKMVASKDAEIKALEASLLKGQSDAQTVECEKVTNDEISEIRKSSQEEIYRLESVIREMEDRLGSGLGAYKVEDIRIRDEEIAELRTANEAAQEWMGKAVEHHQMNSAKISQLTEEKVALAHQLEEEQMQVSSHNINGSSTIHSELAEKCHELGLMKNNFSDIQTELQELKREKESNQGLLDELGIAMDDVKIMQQQLLEYKVIVTELETKLTGNTLHEENLELKSSNKDMKSKIVEFEEWTQTAQNKISNIIGAKEKAESELLDAKEELQELHKESEILKSRLVKLEDNGSELESLQNDISTLKSTNDYLQDNAKERDNQYLELESKYNDLLEKSQKNEQNLISIAASRDNTANDLATERKQSHSQCTEIENLKAENANLLTSLERLKDESQSREDTSELLANQDEIKINELIQELEKTKLDLKEANQVLSKDEDVVREWEDRVLQLDSNLANVHQQMEDQERDALDAIAKWQQNCTELEERCAELEEELKNTLDAARESSEVKSNPTDNEYLRLKENNTSLQEKVNLLESSLAEQSDSRRKDEIAELQDALEVAQNTLSRDEEIVQKWEERVTELEMTVEFLKNDLREQEHEANDVISKWQENCEAAESKYFALEEELEEMKTLKETNVSIDNSSVDQIQYRKVADALSLKDEELREVRKDAESNQESANKLKDQVLSLENRIQEIQNEFEFERESAKKALKQVEDSVELKEKELQEIRILSENSNLSQVQKEERIQGLSRHIDSLNEQFRNREYEKNNVIEQLKKKLGASEKEAVSLREKFEETKSRLQALQNSLSADDLIVRQCEERTRQLEDQLKEQEQDACDTIAQWEATCSILETKCSILDIEVKNNLQNISDRNWSIEQLISRNDSYVALVKELKAQKQDAFETIAQREATCSVLETKCSNLEMEVKNKLQKISDCNWSIEQLVSLNDSYVSLVKELRSESLKVETTAIDDISRAKSEIVSLTEALEAERTNRVNEREQLQAEILSVEEKHRNTRNEIKILKLNLEEVEEIKVESDNTLNEWTSRYEELECAFKECHQQLEDQEKEANEVISMWESKTEDLEKDLDVAEDILQRLEDILIVNEDDDSKSIVQVAENVVQEINDVKYQLSRAKSFIDARDEKINDYRNQNKVLEDKLSIREKTVQGMKVEIESMKHQLLLKSQDKLEEERDRLIGEVAQIEEELRGANTMLQACVTDGSTDKATEVAANGLREEINLIRSQLDECEQKYEDEKAAREVADLEINRLSDDIAALLSLSEHENNPTKLKKLTTKSIEKLQKIEHSEIDDLRKSLFRALEELELTRSAEKDSNETISKIRLHISVYEQEIIAAKSEINFLSEAMEELRQTEDSKRASLEYRIGSLENENDVVRKYQSTELENVRNELAQVSMEKDMIIHKLKETEKTNASLVLAASNDVGENSSRRNNTESECAKLRVENSHLLTVAADDKGRAERKMRELLSAQIASSELDVILERELRLSAEAAQETLKEELTELRSTVDTNTARKSDNGQYNNSGMKSDEINSMRSSLQSLEEENSRLKLLMKEESSNAKNKIEVLTDEFRKAQVRACKNDRNTRTELAVQSELAKMRSPAISLNGEPKYWNENFIRSSRNALPGTNYNRPLPSIEAYDIVKKQQQDIQEERLLYSETLQEHEDLLALVAQYDLEKSCLREALVEVAGDETAANEALKRAQGFAVERYGHSIQVVKNDQ